MHSGRLRTLQSQTFRRQIIVQVTVAWLCFASLSQLVCITTNGLEGTLVVPLFLR